MSYETALGAVFIEGWIFVFLAVTSLRLRLIRLVPKSIMLATSAGIGLYLAFIGLQNVEGLGVVSFDSTTLVTLGGCPQQHQVRPGRMLTSPVLGRVDSASESFRSAAFGAGGAAAGREGCLRSCACTGGRLNSAQAAACWQFAWATALQSHNDAACCSLLQDHCLLMFSDRCVPMFLLPSYGSWLILCHMCRPICLSSLSQIGMTSAHWSPMERLWQAIYHRYLAAIALFSFFAIHSLLAYGCCINSQPTTRCLPLLVYLQV